MSNHLFTTHKMQAILFFDFDSTLCQLESLDQALIHALANDPNRTYIAAQIEAITALAMSGSIDLEQSIKQRLALLPLSMKAIEFTARKLSKKLTVGITELLNQLRADNHEVHIISGGFQELIEPSREALDVPQDQCHANQFLFTDGFVSGVDSSNPLLISGGKSVVISRQVHSRESPVFMIGDGYNDLQVHLNWHSDVSYNTKPTKAVILKSIKIPPVGGDTCFSNMELAWETLDEKIKEIIKDKKAVHSSLGAEFFLKNYKKMEGNGKKNYDEYSNEHPIVRTHPETGKKILYVNWTYTKKIIGLSQKESDEILTKIFEHQARLELTCRFTWTENTVCIWDNRSVIHFAIADFYPGRGLGYERIMDRIAIEGDHPN